MKLELVRKVKTEESTIGVLSVDGKIECFTLEDKEREEKIWGETAIPVGQYEVGISYSPHFKKDLPILFNVPGYEGVRIHSGNTAADTEGCILVGTTSARNQVLNSRIAFQKLFDKIKIAVANKEKIILTIK